MRTQFVVGDTRYEPGQTFGIEKSRGWGRNPTRTLYREWTRWTYVDSLRAWIHDGKVSAPVRATKMQIINA